MTSTPLADRSPDQPFDPPPNLTALPPISPLTFPDGHQGWLVTGHAQIRAILSDQRFSARRELMHYPLADLGGPPPPTPPGTMNALDAPEHTRFRTLLAGKFTVRRMRALTERVELVTAEHLDAMRNPPVDLVATFAQPVPAIMICELLGVPYADRHAFQQHTATITGVDATPEQAYAAYDALGKYVHELVLNKRAKPTDDLLSDLTDSDLSDAELTGVASFLLAAGLDTTANMIALGAFALLRHPGQLAALRDDPDAAAEELLRYLSIAHTLARVPLVDVDLDGQLIRAGQTVALAVGAANRDPTRFPDPNTLDLRRPAIGHLAFGHGVHQCLGQQLARVELRVALPALFTRLPTLRLAVPPAEVSLRQGTDVYGVHRLPVTWDAA